MDKPRIFLGSSGKQTKLLQAITRGLDDVADVEPWTTTFNPGRSTLDRLVELSQEVDFAAFVFAQDDWTTTDAIESGQASPRDNVVFEAGLFGGALGIRRTFILHANDSKLPSDLLGLTSVRYDPATSAAEVRAINQKLRKAIETEGRRGAVEGLWWQLSLTARSEEEPSAVSLLSISRDRDGGLNVTGRAWQEDGTLSARYSSQAVKERRDPAGIFYFWKGERPRAPNAPQLEGTGEITARNRRPRHRVLDHAVGSRRPAECPNRRRLPSSRPLRPPGARQRKRGRAGRAHRAAAPGVEVGVERFLSTLPSWYLVAENDEVIPPDAERQFARDGRRHDRGRERSLRDGLHPEKTHERIVTAAKAVAATARLCSPRGGRDEPDHPGAADHSRSWGRRAARDVLRAVLRPRLRLRRHPAVAPSARGHQLVEARPRRRSCSSPCTGRGTTRRG